VAFQFAKSNDSELNSEINIIPMVDIMLVLLIIFMVAAPLMNDTVDVKLPKARAKSGGVDEESVVVAIKKDESLFIGKTAIGLNDLNKKLESIFANREKKEIFIRADEQVTHGFIIKVMAGIQGAGVYKISFLTDPTK
jgi:biopolymer transport protein TolR